MRARLDEAALVTALPRTVCPVCGKSVALRRRGELREHYVYRPQAEQDPTAPLGRMRVCEGSGQVAPSTLGEAGG